MTFARVLLLLLLAGALASAAPEEQVTAYSLVEIEGYLNSFKKTYKNKNIPEEDAISVLEDLKKAHKYITSKGEEATKEELKIQKRIVSDVAKGLKTRNRPLVTLECARALGEMPDKRGAKDLFRWMDGTVLDAKSPNPQWVEYGFKALAHIGGEDKAALDMLRSYGTGKHVEIGVASQALKAIYEWRHYSGKNRKELFEKIVQYLSGLWSGKQGGDVKKRGTYEKRWDAVKTEGLKALRLLAGVEKPFRDPPEAMEWWKENKRRKWEPYDGPAFRKPVTQPKKDEPAASG